ncbi:YdcF family protein [Nocardia stercoris]|uniref:YdcF family protein n=2 Tax=Nocardia stercoris TaxID=2483361 RepID=A0A3M2L1T5_9NOCA|nr:YdcF family protein [Nocardia stercoris]
MALGVCLGTGISTPLAHSLPATGSAGSSAAPASGSAGTGSALAIPGSAAPATAPDPADSEAAAMDAASKLPGLSDAYGPDTAIVVLGYGLQDDGQMRPQLLDRLFAAYAQAVLTPLAPVIVTGGNPENGITEADAMRDWLIGHGIDATRIHSETRADNTIENAKYSAQMMDDIGAKNAVLITSADHLPRAQRDFADAGVRVVGTVASEDVSDPVPSRPRYVGDHMSGPEWQAPPHLVPLL